MALMSHSSREHAGQLQAPPVGRAQQRAEQYEGMEPHFMFGLLL
ncbi:hypothetical protein [Paenibacillus massiliensis]|nr:hypothetical protein [Paenibacillus massiliensis]